MWTHAEEMLALMREQLYMPVVGDILDQMGYSHQFLPAPIRRWSARCPITTTFRRAKRKTGE